MRQTVKSHSLFLYPIPKDSVQFLKHEVLFLIDKLVEGEEMIANEHYILSCRNNYLIGLNLELRHPRCVYNK